MLLVNLKEIIEKLQYEKAYYKTKVEKLQIEKQQQINSNKSLYDKIDCLKEKLKSKSTW